MQQVIEELGLKGIRCEHLRAEDAGRDKKHREKYDYVTARAVARLSVLSEYCLPLAKKGGQFIALKGSKFAEEITEGEILIDGVHLSKENENEVRTEMGMVFQSFNLFPHMSVLDNVTIGPRKVRGIDRKEAEKKALGRNAVSYIRLARKTGN